MRGVDLVGAPVDLLDVGVVLGRAQHARDDAALSGHAQALLRAQELDAVQAIFVGIGHAAAVDQLALFQRFI